MEGSSGATGNTIGNGAQQCCYSSWECTGMENSTLAQGGVYGRLGRAGQVCLHHALLLQSHSQQSHPWWCFTHAAEICEARSPYVTALLPAPRLLSASRAAHSRCRHALGKVISGRVSQLWCPQKPQLITMKTKDGGGFTCSSSYLHW